MVTLPANYVQGDPPSIAWVYVNVTRARGNWVETLAEAEFYALVLSFLKLSKRSIDCSPRPQICRGKKNWTPHATWLALRDAGYA